MTQPERKTCLCEVIAVSGDEFAVDKPLFAPRSLLYRHPQNHDKGTIWVDGEKRRLQSVRRGRFVWYRLRGLVPAVGATLNCQLDQDIRDLACRAHSALHLLLAALPYPMVEHPEVKGAGHVRMTFADHIAPKLLAAALQQVQQAIAANTPIRREFLDHKFANLTPQAFHPPNPHPGPDPANVVTIGATRMPCDGTHVARTGDIGRVVVSHAAAGRHGFVVGARVQPR